MNPNNKPKIFSDGFTGTLAIIGGIVGTIVFVVTVFGEWYADFDIEPVGLITGILTIAVFLLPFALSILIGGGMGLLAGAFLGVFIEVIVNAIVSFVRNKVEQARIRKERRRASKSIKKSNKSIQDDIVQLESLRKQVPTSDRAIVANYHLCLLLEKAVDNKKMISGCLSSCEEKYKVLTQIRGIESRIKSLAIQYDTIGDNKSANYYLSIIEQGRR